MLTPRCRHRSAARFNARGFTLVELLVVIGIIAILAGVSLGPIAGGLRKAQQSGAIQGARSIALAEFQYASDNNYTYPFGATFQPFVSGLFTGNYISDTSMLVIGGSGEKKFTGATPATAIAQNNSSYDFVQQTATRGINSTAPDQLPVVFSSTGGYGAATALNWSATAGTVVNATITSSSPLGTAGIAVCNKGNSAKFLKATGTSSPQTVAITDATYPGFAAVSVPGGG